MKTAETNSEKLEEVVVVSSIYNLLTNKKKLDLLKLLLEWATNEVEKTEELPQEELPYKGQVCWGRRENKWQIGHFIRKSEEGKYEISANPEDERGIAFAEITTKNPYAVEEEDGESKLLCQLLHS